MKTIKLFVFTACSAIAVLLSGCTDKKEPKPVLNYEQPAYTMVRAIKVLDTESYLRCFTQGAREKYENGDSYNSRLTEALLPKQGNSQAIITAGIASSSQLDEEQISQLEKNYKNDYHKRIDISKAYSLSVIISTLHGENELSDEREIIVVNTPSGWLIYGEVIESFDFKK